MSYVRWSSLWPDPFTNDVQSYLDAAYTDGEYQGLDKLVEQAKKVDPECELSDWYIFWHDGFGSDKETHTREDQLLAMWLAGEEGIPVLPYAVVKQMYETGDWSPLGYEKITQPHILRDCVALWLKNVEQEYT